MPLVRVSNGGSDSWIGENQCLVMGNTSNDSKYFTPDTFTKGVTFSKTINCFSACVYVNVEDCNTISIGGSGGWCDTQIFKSDGSIYYLQTWGGFPQNYDVSDASYVMFTIGGSSTGRVNVTISFKAS